MTVWVGALERISFTGEGVCSERGVVDGGEDVEDDGEAATSDGGGDSFAVRLGAGAGVGLCLRRGMGSFAWPPAAASCWTWALTGTARVTPAIWRTRWASSDAGSLRLTSEGGELEMP